ncbi:MAG TPA: N-acetylmuramidase family protein [Burkholderiaceae bacterium]|jgi:hypothetical protein
MSKHAKKSEAPQKTLPNPVVEASFVFVDRLKLPIESLNVKIQSDSINQTAVTDKDGHAITVTEAKRGEKISIYVRKRNGTFDLKGTVTPQRDINAYTIRSPELHLEATTRLTPKQELEDDLKIPTIKEGEIMTVERLFGELAPFVGAVEIITEVGKVTKDFPTKKTHVEINPTTGKKKVVEDSHEEIDPTTGKKKKIADIEHHYKVVKTDKPHTIALNLLGSRLNYPISGISENQFQTIAERLGCEIAAVKAVTYTETGGGGYLENGLPKILYERHKFYRFTKPTSGPHPFTKFPDICNPTPGGYKGGIHEYERLIKAAKLNKEAAIKSCSWGAFQVLAEYHKEMKYLTAAEVANKCMRSIDDQIEIFIAYLTSVSHAAKRALIRKDWVKFTAAYNGDDWDSTNPDYPGKMENYYNEFKTK